MVCVYCMSVAYVATYLRVICCICVRKCVRIKNEERIARNDEKQARGGEKIPVHLVFLEFPAFASREGLTPAPRVPGAFSLTTLFPSSILAPSYARSPISVDSKRVYVVARAGAG